MQKKMRPIPIEDVITKPKVLVDMYIQLSAAKYILIAKAGAQTPVEHFKRYMNKNVGYLFVQPDDYAALLAQTITVAGMIVGKKNISEASKMAVIEDAIDGIFKEVTLMGFHDETLSHAKLVNEATLTLISTTPSLLDLVEKMGSLNENVAKHNLVVSMIATMLGIGHDWIKPSTLEKLALGGLLHDVGKLKMPKELLQKPADRHTKDEKIIYQSHPEVGRQMLQGIRGMPDDVVLMVYEHHELSDGTGFPRGLKDFQISPLARTVALANAFAEMALSGNQAPTIQTAVSALEALRQKRSSQFNKDAMKVFDKILTPGTQTLAG